MDPNAECPPSLNFDISGLGVRISFYLQALFLAGLAARSDSSSEITGALYTLVITNTAYAVTTMILGFRSRPEVTLNDAVIVCYLLSGSWFAVYFALAPYNRFKKADKFLKYLSILHSYVLFAYGFAVLVTAPNFGSNTTCNSEVVVVIFRPFPAINQGRIVGIVALVFIVLVYSGLLIIDYNLLRFVTNCFPPSGDHTVKRSSKKTTSPRTSIVSTPLANNTRQVQTIVRRRDAPTSDQPVPPLPSEFQQPIQGHNIGIDGRMLVTLVFIAIIWSLVVLNTELLIRWNKFSSSDGSQWQFGQVLPMFLVIIPLFSLYKAFREHGLRRKPSKRKHRLGTRTSRSHSGVTVPPPVLSQNTSTFGEIYPGSLPQARISQQSVHDSDESSDSDSVEQEGEEEKEDEQIHANSSV